MFLKNLTWQPVPVHTVPVTEDSVRVSLRSVTAGVALPAYTNVVLFAAFTGLQCALSTISSAETGEEP